MMEGLTDKNDKTDVVEDDAELFSKKKIIASRGTDGVRFNLLLITKVV